MAGTIQSFLPAQWDARVDLLDARQKCKIAVDGPSAIPVGLGASDAATDANRVANAVLAGIIAARAQNDADFVIDARTTASETFAVAELLTARLVPFPADSQRVIQIDVYVAGDAANEMQWFRHMASVTGGATPVVNVVGLTQGTTAGTATQAPGNLMSGAAAGFAGNSVTVVAGAGTLTVNVVSTEAEIINWRVEIRIGKLQPMPRGV